MNSDQLSIYKEERKRKYEEHIRKTNLQKKIISLMKDKSNNPANVIQKFARNYVLRKTVNDIHDVPSLYRKRIPISEFNFFDHTIQEQIETSIDKEKKDNYDRIVKELTEGVTDETMKKAIIDSLDINGDILDNCEYNPINETIYWVQVDLRIYGPHSELPCYIEDVDMTLYFTKKQQKHLKHIWNCIDPSVSRGLRYQQMLDCSKSLVELYNMK